MSNDKIKQMSKLFFDGMTRDELIYLLQESGFTVEDGDEQIILDGCKFCKPKNPKTLIGGKVPYISAWVKIYVNENDVRLGLNARGESDIRMSVSVNYCPMCGRKL